jgi:hypothetical protein
LNRSLFIVKSSPGLVLPLPCLLVFGRSTASLLIFLLGGRISGSFPAICRGDNDCFFPAVCRGDNDCFFPVGCRGEAVGFFPPICSGDAELGLTCASCVLFNSDMDASSTVSRSFLLSISLRSCSISKLEDDSEASKLGCMMGNAAFKVVVVEDGDDGITRNVGKNLAFRSGLVNMGEQLKFSKTLDLDRSPPGEVKNDFRRESCSGDDELKMLLRLSLGLLQVGFRKLPGDRKNLDFCSVDAKMEPRSLPLLVLFLSSFLCASEPNARLD